MVIFIGGLNAIPQVFYEAASIDGANKVQRFFRITLPLLKPTTLLVLVLTTINALKVYQQVVVLTQGGPGRRRCSWCRTSTRRLSPNPSELVTLPRSPCVFPHGTVVVPVPVQIDEGGTIMPMTRSPRSTIYSRFACSSSSSFSCCFLPMFWVVMSAFKSETELVQYPPRLFPKFGPWPTS